MNNSSSSSSGSNEPLTYSYKNNKKTIAIDISSNEGKTIFSKICCFNAKKFDKLKSSCTTAVAPHPITVIFDRNINIQEIIYNVLKKLINYDANNENFKFILAHMIIMTETDYYKLCSNNNYDNIFI